MEEIKKVIAELREKYRNTVADTKLEFVERHIRDIEENIRKCDYRALFTDLDLVDTDIYHANRFMTLNDRIKLYETELKFLEYIDKALMEHCGCIKDIY